MQSLCLAVFLPFTNAGWCPFRVGARWFEELEEPPSSHRSSAAGTPAAKVSVGNFPQAGRLDESSDLRNSLTSPSLFPCSLGFLRPSLYPTTPRFPFPEVPLSYLVLGESHSSVLSHRQGQTPHSLRLTWSHPVYPASPLSSPPPLRGLVGEPQPAAPQAPVSVGGTEGGTGTGWGQSDRNWVRFGTEVATRTKAGTQAGQKLGRAGAAARPHSPHHPRPSVEPSGPCPARGLRGPGRRPAGPT